MSTDLLKPHLDDLEQTLVKQFRSLQKLFDVAHQERAALLADRPADVQSCVEAKEALLDQISLLEEHRRMLVQEIAVSLELHSDTSSVSQLFPHLDTQRSIVLQRLTEGITRLVDQLRDFNYGNHALAQSRLDWLRAFQSFLVNVALPDPGYGATGSPGKGREPAALGYEFRA